MLLSLVLAGVVVGGHEFFVRNNQWAGGFVCVVNYQESVVSVVTGLQKYDLLVIGSSRAKESVRPSVLDQVLGARGRSVNVASHSGTSPDVIHMIADWIRAGPIRLPRDILVTVEPLHFSTAYVMLGRPQGVSWSWKIGQ